MAKRWQTRVLSAGAPAPARETILLTHAGRPEGTALARALGRRGYRVVGVDANPGREWLRSRYVRAGALAPDPAAHAYAFCEELLRIARREGAALVVPGQRAAVQALIQARTPIERIAKVALPLRDAWERVRHGGRFHDFAHGLGLPLPALRRVGSLREAVLFARDLGYPVELRTLLAPAPVTASSFAVDDWIRANHESALARAAFALLETGPLLLRRAPSGAERELVLLADGGRPVSAYQYRVPIADSRAVSAIGAPNDTELFEYATALLHALRWTGLARLRFRLELSQWVLADVEATGGAALAESEAAGIPLAHGWMRLCLDGGRRLESALAERAAFVPPPRFPWDDPLPELPALAARARDALRPRAPLA
jgi:hypothetical protein